MESLSDMIRFFLNSSVQKKKRKKAVVLLFCPWPFQKYCCPRNVCGGEAVARACFCLCEILRFMASVPSLAGHSLAAPGSGGACQHWCHPGLVHRTFAMWCNLWCHPVGAGRSDRLFLPPLISLGTLLGFFLAGKGRLLIPLFQLGLLQICPF